ncbi:recombinase family protein [Microbacterium sp. W4I20]|uniref:recombinase family protein n=1 Tax=Microbacterium sp. W4I20 TaxID=3042262 RepID=UPI002784932D|nr:recombinase family protein [Microbacterium sp. W4I20]MDQ0725697.1 DNA invertase Pin-like site-specific DNA recombinase [Microbacterium sp. W4I20]
MTTSSTSRTYGYVRVSTRRQTVDQQMDALLAAGVPADNIYGDVISGAKWDRDGLSDLRKLLRSGDTLVVVALDRLGRSLSEMVKLLDWIVSEGIELRSLREGIDLTTPTGRMLAGIFASLAEYERALILERAEAARDAARARGRQLGRPKSMDAEKIETARALLASGISRVQVAKRVGVSRAALYREIPVV